jgi:hypothetical protein
MDSVPSCVGDLIWAVRAISDLADSRQISPAGLAAGSVTNRLWNQVAICTTVATKSPPWRNPIVDRS